MYRKGRYERTRGETTATITKEVTLSGPLVYLHVLTNNNKATHARFSRVSHTRRNRNGKTTQFRQHNNISDSNAWNYLRLMLNKY